MTKPEYRIGVCLSGGAARGITHLGVLQALNEEGIYPDVISGVSGGAILGALYAAGKEPLETLELFKEEKLVCFIYHKGRGREAPEDFLEDFEGVLQSDGYAAYNRTGKRPEITHVGCMAHIRRKFVESLDNDRERAEHVLALIGELYGIEREAREKEVSEEELRVLREERARPLLQELIEWTARSHDVLPKSKMGKALAYAREQLPRMRPYLTDPRVPLDNNGVENTIRPVALGRKNYLFAGSHEGAERAAMIYSFLGTCRKNGLEPYQWFRETLERLPEHPANRIGELLPGAQTSP